MKNKTNKSSDIVTGIMSFTLLLTLLLVTPMGLSFGWSVTIIIGITMLAGYLTAKATKQDDTE